MAILYGRLVYMEVNFKNNPVLDGPGDFNSLEVLKWNDFQALVSS